MKKRTFKRAKLVLGLGTVGVLGLAWLLSPTSEVRGATAHHLVQIHSEEDSFLNYDFESENHSRHNVDWAIDLLFWNDSSVNTVKRILEGPFPSLGGPMYAYFDNGGGWKWDTDKGAKEQLFSNFGDVTHFRIYGPPGHDHFFNVHWGFYNIASAHIDHNEVNVIDKWSGESEKAEHIIDSDWRYLLGRRSVFEDHNNFENFQSESESTGGHHWENNAYASKLRVPELLDRSNAT